MNSLFYVYGYLIAVIQTYFFGLWNSSLRLLKTDLIFVGLIQLLPILLFCVVLGVVYGFFVKYFFKALFLKTSNH